MDHHLLCWAESHGYLVAWAPVSLLDGVRAEFEERRASGQLDPAFTRENLSFVFDAPSRSPGLDTLLVIVLPRPAHRVSFIVTGRRVDTLLPPTYERYRPVFEDVRQDLVAHGLPGARVELLEAPLKPIATRLDLVRYGRNNVTYAPSIGSYLQLVGYVTDADLPVAPGWRPCEPRLLDECEECGVCEAACPTRAIDGDRVLLHAERCLTVINENPGAWPSWVPASAHECLIGCLRCQRFCPANAQLRVEQSGVTFTEAETAALLADAPRTGAVWTGIREKLEGLGRPYDEPVLARNLRALVGAAQERRPGASGRLPSRASSAPLLRGGEAPGAESLC